MANLLVHQVGFSDRSAETNEMLHKLQKGKISMQLRGSMHACLTGRRLGVQFPTPLSD